MPSTQPSMSSQLDQISTILGEYMLKGWTLTDLQCSTCHISPLMREPAAQASAAGRNRIQFCAFCDGSPEGHTPPHAPTPTLTQATPETAPPAADFDSPLDPHPPLSSSGSTRSLSLRERPPSAPPTRALPSTPLTSDPIAGQTRSNPSSIRASTLSPAFIPRSLPTPTGGNTCTISQEEISELISQRLLQGYSLLQTNCPNASCRGVPLIGYPRAKDGSRDPRRTCVNCGTGYVSEGAMGGMRPMQSEAGPSGTSSTREAEKVSPSKDIKLDVSSSAYLPESPRSKKRREMYETGEAINKTLRPAPLDSAPNQPQTWPASIKDENDDDLLALNGRTTSTTTPQQSGNTITASLDRVTSSLTLTLDRLSESLASHTTGRGEAGEARYFVDVKLHTEAMRDVMEVLERVKRLR